MNYVDNRILVSEWKTLVNRHRWSLAEISLRQGLRLSVAPTIGSPSKVRWKSVRSTSKASRKSVGSPAAEQEKSYQQTIHLNIKLEHGVLRLLSLQQLVHQGEQLLFSQLGLLQDFVQGAEVGLDLLLNVLVHAGL